MGVFLTKVKLHSWIESPKEWASGEKRERKKKKTFVLSSSLRISDPFLLLEDPGLLINLPIN